MSEEMSDDEIGELADAAEQVPRLEAEIERLRALVAAADELYSATVGRHTTRGQAVAIAEYAKLRNAHQQQRSGK